MKLTAELARTVLMGAVMAAVPVVALAQPRPAISAGKVPSVYLPPLARPAVKTADSATLSRIGSGLRKNVTAKSAEAAKSVVIITLRQVGLAGDFGSVQAVGNARANPELRDDQKTEALNKKYEEAFRNTQ
ncbi:hypothetical protein [Hymenobacter terricola]|uniref:hypothetical protein n=1 Tax=Hymenobacter terricola TaxID=2819236 RepID=UPI001B300B77|nr:hypothetical protein [Hymenobacter terricola]